MLMDTPMLSQQFSPPFCIVPCSHFTFERLADIYNDTRVDYIVPMPMNARRVQEYVHDYDIDLDQSIVVDNGAGRAVAMGMLAFRGERAWITRLGVCPDQRGRKLGDLVMDELLQRARAHRAKDVQLEVIVGNDPAARLFIKKGFVFNRELLILNRPPSSVSPQSLHEFNVTQLSDTEIFTSLQTRSCASSWLDDTESLINTGHLIGFRASHSNGATGWLICKKSRFQFSHFALDVGEQCPHETMLALLDALHRSYPTQDAKFENLDSRSPALSAFMASGYIEVFRRTEMLLSL
jgi:ribosomal protein S18 acetylase RimI-like enzyme